MAVKAGLVAIQEIEAAGLIAERAKGQGGAGAWVVGCGIVLIHFDFQGRALNGPEGEKDASG